MTVVSDERRAELRAAAMRLKDTSGYILLGPMEALALLDATEPVADAEVADMLDTLHAREEWERLLGNKTAAEEIEEAAALIERLARQVAELQQEVARLTRFIKGGL